VRSAAYSAAKLMELRETKSFRAFDHHHRRVRDVDPNLDH